MKPGQGLIMASDAVNTLDKMLILWRNEEREMCLSCKVLSGQTHSLNCQMFAMEVRELLTAYEQKVLSAETEEEIK